MKIVIIIVDFMKNIPMEFKSSVVLPEYVSLQSLWKNSHCPLSKPSANLHLLKRLGG